MMAATTFAPESFCVTRRQMKIDVMANEAIASGMPIAFPMSTPTTHEIVQEDCEQRFTSVAR